jgi:hypothetical protein
MRPLIDCARPHATTAIYIMRRRLATLALAIAGLLCGASAGWAQTVVVTNAPPGTTIELLRDAAVVGSAVASPQGVATVAVPEAARSQQDMDGLLFVDVCPDRHRVLIVQRNQQPAPLEATCTRQEIPGLFLIRPISTLAINVSASPPRLLLRQGPFDPTKPPRVWAQVPIGLVFSAGAGIHTFSDPSDDACGNVADCDDDGIGTSFAGGVAFWPIPYVGAEVIYVRPREWSAEGQGDSYHFTSTLDAEMLTTTALLGGPVGPTRMYGKIGGGYHRATFSTTQAIEDRTVTVDGETRLVQGGTQTIAYRTQGWGWAFGGGFELWLSRYVAAYADMTIAQLRGGDPNGGEGEGKDRLSAIVGGVKVHFRRR